MGEAFPSASGGRVELASPEAQASIYLNRRRLANPQA